MDLEKIKKLIESNPVALATVMDGVRPNVIGVASVKVVLPDKVIITDNYMSQTIKDISENSNVCLIVWDSDLAGYKIIGRAVYYTKGEWKVFVEKLEENKGFPAKGAIVVNVSKIIPAK